MSKRKSPKKNLKRVRPDFEEESVKKVKEIDINIEHGPDLYLLHVESFRQYNFNGKLLTVIGEYHQKSEPLLDSVHQYKHPHENIGTFVADLVETEGPTTLMLEYPPESGVTSSIHSINIHSINKEIVKRSLKHIGIDNRHRDLTFNRLISIFLKYKQLQNYTIFLKKEEEKIVLENMDWLRTFINYELLNRDHNGPNELEEYLRQKLLEINSVPTKNLKFSDLSAVYYCRVFMVDYEILKKIYLDTDNNNIVLVGENHAWNLHRTLLKDKIPYLYQGEKTQFGCTFIKNHVVKIIK